MRLSATCAAGLAALTLTGAAHAQDDLVGQLPEELQAIYVGTTSTALPSAYADFEPVEGPWRWCHSESYQGNPWRVTVTNELRRLVEGGGHSFDVSDSNGDTAQQINQIRSFIDKECDVITTIAGSATALDEVIKAAYDAGIPVITAAGSVTSPYAINVDNNYAAWGYDMMQAIVDEVGADANVLIVEGIAGHPIVVQEREGAERALQEHPDLNIVREVNGNWTANVTKNVVLQALATYPGPIDAVWTTGSESRVVAEAFEEAGRPAPLITGSSTGDAIGYWKENPDTYRFSGHAVWPHWLAQAQYRVAARILDGQNPKLNSIMLPLPPVTMADLPDLAEDCMTPDAVSVFPIPSEDPVPESMIDAFFEDPAPSPGYDYGTVPSACD